MGVKIYESALTIFFDVMLRTLKTYFIVSNEGGYITHASSFITLGGV